MIKKSLSGWLPVLAWCSLIFYISSIPNLKTEFGFWDLILRKGAHMFEYAVLFLLSSRALDHHGLSSKRSYTLGFIFTVIYACSDEFHQSFVPTRGPSIGDVGIDSLGILFGAIAKKTYFKRIKSDTL